MLNYDLLFMGTKTSTLRISCGEGERWRYCQMENKMRKLSMYENKLDRKERNNERYAKV